MLISHFISEKQAHILVSCWYFLQYTLAVQKQFVILN